MRDNYNIKSKPKNKKKIQMDLLLQRGIATKEGKVQVIILES